MRTCHFGKALWAIDSLRNYSDTTDTQRHLEQRCDAEARMTHDEGSTKFRMVKKRRPQPLGV